jgi:tripartite-type tricarboxylate transporter receptor subunit TctC
MTKENSMLRLIAAAVSLFASLLGASNQAPAQQYPERAIKFVVPFAPGSATDALARILAEKLGDAQGWTVVVENIAGASGMLAAQNVARASPDGHTVFITSNTTHAANQSLFKKLPYDPIADFEPEARRDHAGAGGASVGAGQQHTRAH